MTNTGIKRILFFLLFSSSTLSWSLNSTSTYTIADGLTYTHIQTDTTGILRNYNILKLDYTKPDYEITIATATAGRESVRSISQRVHGIAAINGGYFELNGQHV